MTVSLPLSSSVLLSHNPVGSSPSSNRFFAGSISQFALLIESTNLAADLFCFPRYGFWDDLWVPISISALILRKMFYTQQGVWVDRKIRSTVKLRPLQIRECLKMVRWLTYRKRHKYATKSNQHRVVKTLATKKRASGPKCPVTGKRIQGIPHLRPA
ncbi:hypothetical protein ACB092_10G102800 [Castanea dentata]